MGQLKVANAGDILRVVNNFNSSMGQLKDITDKEQLAVHCISIPAWVN